jgi:glutamate-1-semialdehyde aminotransferase
VVPTTGTQFNMNEAIGVQILSHIPAMVPVRFSNSGTELTLDVGSTEPRYVLASS